MGIADRISAAVLTAFVAATPAAAQPAAKFGALAVDRAKSFAYGFAYDYPTQAEAERRALEEARERGGNPSVVLVWSGSGCGAYRTVAAKDGDAYGWGVAPTRPEADAIAHREAQKRSNGKPTPNNVWGCNSDSPQPLNVLKIEPVGEAGGEAIVLQNSRLVADIAFSPDGRQVATLSYGDGAVMVWDVRTGRPVRTLAGLSATPYSIAWSPDGARIAGGDSQRVVIWDARSGQKLGENVHKSLLSDLAFTGSGLFANGAQELYDDPRGGWVIWQLDPGNGALVRKVTLMDPHTHGLDDTVFSPDGRLVVTVGDKPGREIRIWDLSSGHTAVTISTQRYNEAAAFSPDGARLVTGGSNGTAVWDVASGRQLLSFGSGRIDDVAFSPDGRRIVTAHMSGVATVWDASTGQALAQMKGHAKRVIHVAFSPDGRVVASGSEDGTARLWDAANGQPMPAPRGPPGKPAQAPAPKTSPKAEAPKPAPGPPPKGPSPQELAEQARAEAERAGAAAAAETARLNAEVAARAAAVDARNKAAAEAYAAKEAAYKAATAKFEQDKAAYEAEAARVRAAQEQYARDQAAYQEQLRALGQKSR